MHKIDLQLFYVGGINIAYDKRFQAPSSSVPKKPVKDDDKYRRMGGGSDVRGISPTERSYRAQQRANTIKPPTMPSFNFSGIGGIGPFKASQAYTDAMNYTNSLLQQLNGGRTAYSDKVDELMNTISNRDKFSYDFNTDPLFQNALASAMKSGATAMQDTIGQASALTGGYGSSYATSAANQAYNSYIQDAYANLPDYYNLALNAYNQEGQELYNQLGMYQTADNTAYGRLADAYSMNLANAQNIWNQEYSNYWDTANYNQAVDKFNAEQKYKANQANYERQQAVLDRFAGMAGINSEKTTGSSSGNEALTFSQFNTLKGDVTDMVKRYGADSSKVDELILQYANNYGLSEQQIAEMFAVAKSSDAPKSYSIITAPNGNPMYADQYGKPYQGSQASISFSVKSVPSGGKATSDQAVYTDNYGHTYTYAELKSRGWTKFIKK